ncbi:hypothetical protein MPL3356_270004 [Mesorhizobium plurifarium]|uniref:Uncharacterized protein n=1 Tax=Mesorhizobium plurifarium TaxID=69974 RepID=A0A090DP10_MESPL|nr:hypothetical protein MPL3356_270004 [Mesorhizobium plurifarium]
MHNAEALASRSRWPYCQFARDLNINPPRALRPIKKLQKHRIAGFRTETGMRLTTMEAEFEKCTIPREFAQTANSQVCRAARHKLSLAPAKSFSYSLGEA